MKTTTDASNWLFEFTITDVARFLGKAPVTLRGWESRGLLDFPRGKDGDRRFTTDDVRQAAYDAKRLGRINRTRLHLVLAVMTMIEMIERENTCTGKTR